MALITANWNPSERQLRQFGWAALVFLTLAGWASLGFRLPVDWSPVESRIMGALLLTGLSFAVITIVKPSVLRPPFIAVSLVTLPIGLVAGELTLLCIYFGVFLPIGA